MLWGVPGYIFECNGNNYCTEVEYVSKVHLVGLYTVEVPGHIPEYTLGVPGYMFECNRID